ncbi:MAG TPA: transcription antitermination factor NusB [Tepidisphaeraceae bacterium]|jgi:N utilization substance protein B
MIRPRLIREIALQVLCVFDSANQADDETALQIALDATDDAPTRIRAMEMIKKTWDYRKDADEWITRLAPQWPARRQPMVDRNLLRMSLFELTANTTPPKVVIDEAIELAKQYSTENSPAFVNGVLDAALKEIQGLKGNAE